MKIVLVNVKYTSRPIGDNLKAAIAQPIAHSESLSLQAISNRLFKWCFRLGTFDDLPQSARPQSDEGVQR
jgi:hypothetical protein